MTAEVIMYSKNHCPYCVRAKSLLDILEQPYTIINLDEQPEHLTEMLAKSNGARSVPQIFIDGEHIGGCDDMYALHESGKLKTLLG
jgi:glutaredoxin 3